VSASSHSLNLSCSEDFGEANDIADSSVDDLTDVPEIVKMRHKDSREVLVLHLNVNSLQNKFEEVQSIITDLRAQIVFLTETKIDSSYPNSQFKQDGYNMYRKDRAKGGGGVMAYISSNLPSKKLKLPKNFNTVEALAIQSKLGRHNALLLGLYRSQKATGRDYYLRLENELHDVISWASIQSELLIVTGDLNLNKLRTDRRECKILCDVEDVHGLTCLIDKPTRTTVKSQTLLDVILTNKPELFTSCDVYDPGISDHAAVYGVMTTRAKHLPTKVISFRSFKSFNEEEFMFDLSTAPWHVGDVFDSLDDQYSYWNLLMNQVLDDHVPLRRMKVRAHDVPHMNCNWKKAIRMKKR